MLALKQSLHRQHIFNDPYNLDSNVQAPYPGLGMEHYHSNSNSVSSFDSMGTFHHLPVTYYDHSAIFTTAPSQSLKQDMYRTGSSHSTANPYVNQHELPPALISSASGPSVPSAASSTVGSPYSGPSHILANQQGFRDEQATAFGVGLYPTIVNQEGFSQEITGPTLEHDLPMGTDKLSDTFVDPSLISASRSFGEVAYSEQQIYANNTIQAFAEATPIHSPESSHHYQPYIRTQFSAPITHENYSQQQPFISRRPSVTSYLSGGSHRSPRSDYDDDGQEKGRCPQPDCGKVFKDLKAHMLTHQAERPEKCPILNCEYNQKGFARKYDKNRHTLTHYKGTMVCGFCPGSGSTAEKSFNRADVFKKHLTTVHGVEQTPPNSRKRSPSASSKKLSNYCQDATGKCSTCTAIFDNAQDFYEHLDDCVLRVVQREEPSEAINAQHLQSMLSDEQVQETLDRHMIKSEQNTTKFDEEEEDDDEEEAEEEEEMTLNSRSGKGSIRTNPTGTTSRAVLNGGISKSGRSSKKGMTWSKGGVPLVGKGRKKRKHYPPSWGMSAEKMQMKKRVLCVYDGNRRLWKDDMMLHNEFEVRMKLPDGKGYVTDLDVETLKRAEAFHNATEAEKGPFLPQFEDECYDGFALNDLIA